MQPRPRACALLLLLASLALPANARALVAGQTVPLGGVSLPAGTLPGGDNGRSDGRDPVAISDDGRYVAFVGEDEALAAGTPLDSFSIYRKDRNTGAVVLVSRASGATGAAAAADGFEPRISDNGNLVAWRTRAQLAPTDTDSLFDVYVRDVNAQTTALVTPPDKVSGDVLGFDLAGGATTIAYTTSVVSTRQVYRLTASGDNDLMSAPTNSTTPGNGDSDQPSISDTGTRVAFRSAATNLGATDNNGPGTDVFTRSVAPEVTTLVSAAGSATAGANGTSGTPRIAGESNAAGWSVAYESAATNLAPGDDASTVQSVYQRRSSITASVLASRAASSATQAADLGDISDDAARLSFRTDDDLGLGGGGSRVFRRLLTGAGATTVVSPSAVTASSDTLAGVADVVAWVSETGITPDASPSLTGVFARSGTGTGATDFVSRPPAGNPAERIASPAAVTFRASSGQHALSGDGRFAALDARSSLLPGGSDAVSQVYRRDVRTGAIELVSRADGFSTPSGAGGASISADGTKVAFDTASPLTATDANGKSDVYVRDLPAGTTTLVSRATGAGGAVGDSFSGSATISADGTTVAFQSNAGNLGAGAGVRQLYVRDLAGATTTLVSRATGASGAAGAATSSDPAISRDGRRVAFTSEATLDPADGSGTASVYVRDLAAATTQVVSRRPGLAGANASGSARSAAISADGTHVAFTTGDSTLAPETPWVFDQVVVRTLSTGANALASRSATAAADDTSGSASLSADGTVVAFASEATNLLPDRGGSSAVFTRDMTTGALDGPPRFGQGDLFTGNGSGFPSVSDDGSCVAFQGTGHTAAGLGADRESGYLFARTAACLPDPGADPVAPPPGVGPRPPVVQIIGVPLPKPVLSKVSLSRKTFRVGSKRTATSAAKQPRRTKAGTSFRFTLSTAAKVAIELERKTTGRRVGKRCKAPSRKLRKRKACTRYVAAGTIARRSVAAGRRSVAFSGRLGRRALKAGRYRATLAASNAGGTSKASRVTFTVVKR